MGKIPDKSIEEASRASGETKQDFRGLLTMIDQYYDKKDVADTQSPTQTFSITTPIEAIFESITEALITVSVTGDIRSCNKICSRYFGVSLDELIGKPLSNILVGAGEKSCAEFLAPFISHLEDTRTEFDGVETLALRADGEKFEVAVNASRLASIDADFFVISLRDISGRKRTESAIQENDERYRALVMVPMACRTGGSTGFCNQTGVFWIRRARGYCLVVSGKVTLKAAPQNDGTPNGRGWMWNGNTLRPVTPVYPGGSCWESARLG